MLALGEIGIEVGSVYCTEMQDQFWQVALGFSGGAAPRREVADPGRFAACRPAVPSASGRSEGAGAGVGRLDSRQVNARR